MSTIRRIYRIFCLVLAIVVFVYFAIVIAKSIINKDLYFCSGGLVPIGHGECAGTGALLPNK